MKERIGALERARACVCVCSHCQQGHRGCSLTRLLDAAGSGGGLAGCLGGELLAGRLASGRLASGLLGTGHGDGKWVRCTSVEIRLIFFKMVWSFNRKRNVAVRQIRAPKKSGFSKSSLFIGQLPMPGYPGSEPLTCRVGCVRIEFDFSDQLFSNTSPLH